ncbi:KAP family NTPase [Marmoricola sp. URHB0036]|uniref:KAP family NTPase n=1 Tax=Marmoricola sp. URHB0036 TaxID=1298863 RepID=UPI00041C58BC|nr:KAP family NTPase [Marmoricola sp. URHB0036]
MEDDGSWLDDPIDRIRSDTIGTRHIAKRLANLVDETHSWNGSPVIGLTGPWGSGKTSILQMSIRYLAQRDTKWKVVRFTPWATADAESLLSEFYSAISEGLSVQKDRELKEKIAACARVVAPALKLIPVAGASAADYATNTADLLTASPSWDKAFKAASKAIGASGTPLLVIADDIDRLQPEELLALLKVVRLLGRFPGVSYVLAYDEETLFATLGQGAASKSTERSRLFMEKIVQYPFAVPPLLPEQMTSRLDAALSAALATTGFSFADDDGRLQYLPDLFESQFLTPRSVDRFVAQLQLSASMHSPGEINIVDLLLVTFVKMQFPRLHGDLPQWRRELTATQSPTQLATGEVAHQWDDLLALVEDERSRRDAETALGLLFPAFGSGSFGQIPLGVSRHSYFPRYFVHAIPAHDVSDVAVTQALRSAASGARGAFNDLLRKSNQDRADLALRKMIAVSELNGRLAPEFCTVELLESLMRRVTGLAGGMNSGYRTQEQAITWAAHILAELIIENTDLSELLRVVRLCEDPAVQAWILWKAQPRASTIGDTCDDLCGKVAIDFEEVITDHLRRRDDADDQLRTGVVLDFILTSGEVDRLRDGIAQDLRNRRFTLADLASRFVSLATSFSAQPIRSIHNFSNENFNRLAPDGSELPSVTLDEEWEETDVSWSNRRHFAMARWIPPTR